MKTIKILSALTILLVSSVFVLNSQNQKKITEIKTAEITFNVSIHCKSCQERIEKNIPFEKGVKDITVDLDDKTVRVIYNPQKTTEEKLAKAFEDLGYTCEKINKTDIIHSR